MKMKIQVLALVLMLSAGAIVQAQERQRRGYSQNSDRWALNLSEDQKAQMEKIRLESRKSMLPLRNEIGEINAKMRTLTTAEDADLKKINSLIDEKTSLMAKMMKVRAEAHQQVREILSEEQRVKFDSGKGRYAERNMAGERHGRGRPRSNGPN